MTRAIALLASGYATTIGMEARLRSFLLLLCVDASKFERRSLFSVLLILQRVERILSVP